MKRIRKADISMSYLISVCIGIWPPSTASSAVEGGHMQLVTIKLKAEIHHCAVPRFGAGGHNQPPQGTLAGFSGRCYNTCPDGSVTESLFLSSSPSVGDRAASG